MENLPTGKVCCRICHDASGAVVPTWMWRSGSKKHLEAGTHLLAAAQLAERNKIHAETRQQYGEIYNMAATSLQAPSMPVNSGPPRPQFRPILDEDSNGISAADFQELMMQEVDDLRSVPQPEQVNNDDILRREVELLRLRHLEQEFEGADDETVPQFIQEIRANGESYRPRCSQFCNPFCSHARWTR